jgi:hypothetical protein
VFLHLFLKKAILNKQTLFGKRLFFIRSFLVFFFQGINPGMRVLFNFLPNLKLTASIITYIIRRRLLQKYSLGEILGKFGKLLDKRKGIRGYRISCNGRFTRRQRATHR